MEQKKGENFYPVSKTVSPLFPVEKIFYPVSAYEKKWKKNYPTSEHCLPGFINGCFTNGFALFSWAVAAGSKGGLMVPGTVQDVIVAVRAILVSM